MENCMQGDERVTVVKIWKKKSSWFGWSDQKRENSAERNDG